MTYTRDFVTSKQGVVLIVDDNDDIRILTSLYLNKAGYKNEVAKSGAEAVDMAQHFRYSLVLMDMAMPGVDGVEATIRIRKHERENALDPVPIVALTAFNLKENRRISMEAGCNDYMVKPFSKNELYQLLEDRILN